MFFLAGLNSCKKGEEKQKDKPPAIVDVMVAGSEEFSSGLEVNGSALSEEMVQLFPEISGRLTFLNLPDGAVVNKGTVLARINDAELQAQAEQLKVQLDLAEKTEQRLKKLLEINGVNQADYDAALSQVNALKANLKIVYAQIDKTVVRAPFRGVLGLRLVSEGAYVNPQTLLGTLQQTDKIKIDFAVPESYAGMVKPGYEVLVKTNNSEESFIAEISASEPMIDVNTRNLKVRAYLKKGNISPGSFVKVNLKNSKQGIFIPSNSIIPEASTNKAIIIKSGKAIFTDIETGIRTEDMVEVISGISPGDSVVVSGVLFVRPNDMVKVRKVREMKMENKSDKKPAGK
ncbi:MAG: hypothetical protein A2W91_01755 [Bacteroidetes bacterium GWF2_38_335]|nr:MAG: hypothetical protein A2W91_01755 [Bacteroidetes bacterium GWF2_38_335]OFY78831.1 MAG: hypothetical protein A2281_19330 [Bacteroidetes bacterium RIFOXYA12_FULL_38_20]